MGTNSIYHIVEILLLSCIVILPIAFASKQKTKTRTSYIGHTIPLLIVDPFIFTFLYLSLFDFIAAQYDIDSLFNAIFYELGIDDTSNRDIAASGFGLLIFFIPLSLHSMTVIWSVHRTNDTGLSRWWNLVFVIPFVGWGWRLALMLIPGRVTLVTNAGPHSQQTEHTFQHRYQTNSQAAGEKSKTKSTVPPALSTSQKTHHNKGVAMPNLMKLNIAAVIIFLLTIIFLPYTQYVGSIARESGWAFFSQMPPRSTIDVLLLVIEWVGVGILYAFMRFIFLKDLASK